MKIFHFTLGPVQSFVGQARRTRDLWAGSFLLSWLSSKAMHAVIDQKGEIIFPKVTDDDNNPVDTLLCAVMKKPDPENPMPQIGSLPNRFKANIKGEFNPEQVAEAVKNAWENLGKAVYKEFVSDIAAEYGNETEKIWDRQIENFWEINWVLGDKPDKQGEDDRWLDMRKNWRSHWPKPEGGDHCTMMGDYQELSGYIRAKSKSQGEPKSQKDRQDYFWNAIRMQEGVDGPLDIRDNERLCAIALVKRLFPKLGEINLNKTIGWVPGGEEESVANWPSTTYMAVAPWLADISVDQGKIAHLKNYANRAQTIIEANNPGYFKKRVSEQATHLPTLAALHNEIIGNSHKWKLSHLDGDLLHVHALRNFRSTYLSNKPLKADGTDNDPVAREKLLTELSKLYKGVNAKPRSYYALLLMDGDNLGKMLREQDQTKVSIALLDFTDKVKACIDEDREHGGVTIYAGGDDVFALLPLNTAIQCAMALRDIFTRSFSDHGIKATASCAIVYAHHQVPLRHVIQKAHHQLDAVAKAKIGRDSLALAVYKPGGLTAQWASAWPPSSPVERMRDLIAAMQNGEYPRGFFHKLRDRYGFYDQEPVAGDSESLDMGKLLVAEYMRSREQDISRNEAEKAVERLTSVCHPLTREDGGVDPNPTKSLKLDGGFITRFLTQEED
ncbi:MAG: type III-B CRISPR-associated protein Cas10/Cmr2 [gamma proteobacterium symbiont of Ctena orbiculata]|nr:MAG: type III-B CRISPR-associated protein Cas10/Cmr2 [gamma proteobacterium symbiont of Ctena orbiculata]